MSRNKQERRSDKWIDKLADFLIKEFEADIRKNDIEYSGALLHVGTTLSSYLFQLVERDFGLILIISSVIILLYVLGERRRIKERYERKLRSLLEGGTYI